jgi:integrase
MGAGGVKKFKEFKRKRFLSRYELRRLGEALRVEEKLAPSAVNCICLLLLTCCRLGEILSVSPLNQGKSSLIGYARGRLSV